MTVTRAPTGQDLVCLVCGTDKDIDIDHVVNRGMGGSKKRDVSENKVPLCRECHTAKTNGVLETEIFSDPGGGLYYQWRRKDADAPWIFDPVEVSQRYKCLVLSAAAEDGTPSLEPESPAGDIGAAQAQVNAPGVIQQDSSAAAPSAGLKEESDGRLDRRNTGEEHNQGLSGGQREGIAAKSVVPATAVHTSHRAASDTEHHPSSLTHDQRVAIAQEIHDTEWNRQWIAGDTANAWRAELGEEAEQYLSDFGYVELSLANIMRVCEAIPPAFRNAALRFSHHVVVAGENLEDVEMHLAECAENGWSVAEFRRQVKGERARVKRWALEELRERAAAWHGHHAFAQPSCGHCEGAIAFVDFLGEQGGQG